MKLIVIVDMQNDFIDGSLGNPAAEVAAKNIIEELNNYGNSSENEAMILFTKDTHYEDYLETFEGKNLPVLHCIKGTPGWEIKEEIAKAVEKPYFYWHENVINGKSTNWVEKSTFGSIQLIDILKEKECLLDEIIFMGVCTDICVVSNVLLARAACPNTPITVIAKCCAGTSNNAHAAALMTMKSCQVDVIER